MGGLATSLTAAQINLIAGALAGIAPPVVALDGAGLYAANCAGCHNPMATSTKAGPSMTVARIQAGIAANAGMTIFATSLNATQLGLVSNALAALPAPVLDGPGLYAANCASCHNPLATSSKGGATAAKIQQEITNKRGATLVGGVLTGGMGAANLVALTPTQVGLIATALAPIAPPACGSCHAVTSATLTSGQHTFHLTNTSKVTGAMRTAFVATTSCGICHGTGYTTTSNGNMLTHNNGIKNIAINAAANSTTIFGIKTWVAPKTTPTVTKGSCTPGCHGAKSW
jgi:mono/diheme cytochrome c family protein